MLSDQPGNIRGYFHQDIISIPYFEPTRYRGCRLSFSDTCTSKTVAPRGLEPIKVMCTTPRGWLAVSHVSTQSGQSPPSEEKYTIIECKDLDCAGRDRPRLYEVAMWLLMESSKWWK